MGDVNFAECQPVASLITPVCVFGFYAIKGGFRYIITGFFSIESKNSFISIILFLISALANNDNMSGSRGGRANDYRYALTQHGQRLQTHGPCSEGCRAAPAPLHRCLVLISSIGSHIILIMNYFSLFSTFALSLYAALPTDLLSPLILLTN